MITPQQIEQVSFDRATFGGYDMQSVDEFLEPLTEDYITLFKENALLKSKMRILVSKLEEYRNNEESMKDAIVNAQKTCDLMVKEAEVKCTQMLTDANALAMENAKNADALIQAEQERVEEARRVAAAKIDALSEQLAACLQALADIKSANAPVKSAANADSPATMDDTCCCAAAYSSMLAPPANAFARASTTWSRVSCSCFAYPLTVDTRLGIRSARR